MMGPNDATRDLVQHAYAVDSESPEFDVGGGLRDVLRRAGFAEAAEATVQAEGLPFVAHGAKSSTRTIRVGQVLPPAVKAALTHRSSPGVGPFMSDSSLENESFSVFMAVDYGPSRATITAELARMGAHVVCYAATAAQAMTQARTRRPCDLVVLDLSLSDGEGIDLVTEFRLLGWPRIMVLASSDDVKAVQAAFHAGAHGYLLKPQSQSVSIRALGMFQVICGEVPIVWRSKKARQLLTILVAQRRPVPRERLMELLWPEVDSTRSANRLSVLLSTLRDLLRPSADRGDKGPLAADRGTVWLDHAQVDIDVEHFLTYAAAALEAHRQNQPDATARLTEAEAAHVGGFLEGDPYQEWAAPLVEEVRATHVMLLRALASRMRQVDKVDEVVRYSLRLLDYDYYDERAHLT